MVNKKFICNFYVPNLKIGFVLTIYAVCPTNCFDEEARGSV